MNWRLKWAAHTNILLMLVISTGSVMPRESASALFLAVSAPKILEKSTITQLSEKELHDKAKSIVVKVLLKDGGWGSGIIIKKQGDLYTIITNAHVVRSADPPYRIQTPDGNIYSSSLLKNSKYKEKDLAIVQFSSSVNYTVASLGKSTTLAPGDEVFAAGFPVVTEKSNHPKQEFVFKSAKISPLMLPKALEGGYKVGYTNYIENGMSGGPLLNSRAEVVGVNGRHAYPLWGASIFEDGSEASPLLHQTIVKYNWAVPIETVLQLTPPSIQLIISPSPTPSPSSTPLPIDRHHVIVTPYE